MEISEMFQQHLGWRDQVFVCDGEREPEAYGKQLPVFNWIDPTSTSTSTAPGR